MKALLVLLATLFTATAFAGRLRGGACQPAHEAVHQQRVQDVDCNVGRLHRLGIQAG